jgi:RimJ/RimL family protein N-acetyltransferase
MQLHFFDEHFREKIEGYEITEEQLQFTGKPQDCIQLSAADPDRFSIVAIEDDQLVTYFDLHINEGPKPYSNNEHAILLRAFSTDARFLGRGHAKQSLLLLPSFVKKHFAGINEIVLGVNLRNETAQGLYKKCGFVDEGVRLMGPKGELIVMSCYI